MTRPLSVLIVDDNFDSAGSLAALLKLRAHNVRVATTLLSGWAAASAERPDVAVLDLKLTDGSGYDLASELAALPGGAPVMVAVNGTDLDDQRAAAVGIARHFLKRSDPSGLIEFLRTCGAKPVTSAGQRAAGADS